MGKVPDTPPEPPTPSSSSSSGAGAGAGASGRAASAAAGAASWWDGVVKFSRRELERGRSKLKGIDLQPHMTVEMDFIKPFATNVKNVWRDACALVPPPVKKAAPFALSAAGGCIVTHAIMKAANKRQQRRHKEELDSLSSWIDTLEEQVRNEKEKFMLASRGSGSEVVSQLTASTAVAAEAAANAAKSAADAALAAARSTENCRVR